MGLDAALRACGKPQHQLAVGPQGFGGFLLIHESSGRGEPVARLPSRLPGIGRKFACDIPLTEGYDWELVPNTSREAMILASVSSLGFAFQDNIMTARNEMEYNQQVGALMVALGYLPAVIMVLRRPNDGELPWWLGWTRRQEVSSLEV